MSGVRARQGRHDASIWLYLRFSILLAGELSADRYFSGRISARDGAVTDDIEIAGGHPRDETIRKAGQLG
jgi:hypothetical protein